jgi:hypothetical protein
MQFRMIGAEYHTETAPPFSSDSFSVKTQSSITGVVTSAPVGESSR